MTNCPRPRSATFVGGVALTTLALLGLCGCGGSGGVDRYELSGAATYGGRPLPAGVMFLQPDTSRGNDGPGTMTEINDGRYQTFAGKGTVGGPHVVRITGYDGPPGGETSGGRRLFREYRFQVDLPRHDASHDFDVPGDHK